MIQYYDIYSEMNQTKLCKKCNIVKSLDEFPKVGTRNRCKLCINAYLANYRKEKRKDNIAKRQTDIINETSTNNLDNFRHRVLNILNNMNDIDANDMNIIMSTFLNRYSLLALDISNNKNVPLADK